MNADEEKTAVIFLTGLMIFTMSGYFVNAADTSAKEENENSNILIAYIPFNSHGGSGFSNTIEEIKELQPDANISDEGLSISRDKVADSV